MVWFSTPTSSSAACAAWHFWCTWFVSSETTAYMLQKLHRDESLPSFPFELCKTMKAANHTYHNVPCVSSMSYFECLFESCLKTEFKHYQQKASPTSKTSTSASLEYKWTNRGARASFHLPSVPSVAAMTPHETYATPPVPSSLETETQSCELARTAYKCLVYNKLYVDFLQTGDSKHETHHSDPPPAPIRQAVVARNSLPKRPSAWDWHRSQQLVTWLG